MAAYVPRQGDLIVLTVDPQAGHEQMGRRPTLVVSVDAFNRGTRFAVCCPITNTDHDTPFHVAVPAESGLTGFVMCEQMKSIDYRARKAKKVAEATSELLDEVLSVIDASLFS